MIRLLDVNVLMALLWENHEHYAKTRSWFKGISAFATCPVVQLGFARVSSHPLLGYGMTPEAAFGVLRQLLADPRHRFVPDDLSCTDRVVRTDLMTGANQITDRYLVALARHRIGQAGCVGGAGGERGVAGECELRGQEQFFIELPRIRPRRFRQAQSAGHG